MNHWTDRYIYTHAHKHMQMQNRELNISLQTFMHASTHIFTLNTYINSQLHILPKYMHVYVYVWIFACVCVYFGTSVSYNSKKIVFINFKQNKMHIL